MPDAPKGCPRRSRRTMPPMETHQPIAAPVADEAIEPPRRSIVLAGLLGGSTALVTLLLGRYLTARPGFLELVADGVSMFIPLQVFEAILGLLGPLAKGLLFAGVSAGVVLAGALAALGLGLRRDRRNPLLAALFVSFIVLAIAELVVLPIFGQGLLGGSGTADPVALHLPLVAAALLYGVVLVGLVREPLVTGGGALGGDARPSQDPAHDQLLPRRSFLGRMLAAIGAGSLLASVLGVGVQVIDAATKRAPRQIRGSAPGGFGPTPAQTPVPEFYQVNKNLLPTAVQEAGWRLELDGLVDLPQAWLLDELRAMPSVEGYRTLECISFDILKGDDLIGNQSWRGVPLATLLDAAVPRPEARWVLWEAEDGYTESLPLAVARDPETWIAYEMGGAPLTQEHGFPARVLIAGRFGMKQPKWLRRIQLADHDEDGYWEQRGWDREAVVRTMSRIDEPRPGDSVPASTPFAAYGIANSGDRQIERVELSADGGTTWLEAELEDASQAPLGPLTWVRWRVEVTAPAAGPLRLVARATDGEGMLQEQRETPPLPSGATGWHAIRVVAVADT